MNLDLNELQQAEMRHAYYDGAAGVLVSGSVWLTSALVCDLLGVDKGIWTLLIGGAMIHPLSIPITKLLGRPAQTSKSNALNQLVMASTLWLILCCAMAFGLSLLRQELFFPAMMASIGCRFMIFASIYGRSIYWLLGASLMVAANLALFLRFPAVGAAALSGTIELIFAFLVFRTASANRLET